MLCVREARRFEPYGSHCCKVHPGLKKSKSTNCLIRNGINSIGPPVVRALRDFTLNEPTSRESWMLRQSPLTAEPCDEELYVSGQVVTWSRGNLLSAGSMQMLHSYVLNSPVTEALWCSFVLPVDREISPPQVASLKQSVDHTGIIQSGICIVEAGSISVFTNDGRDYIAALPFIVKKTWKIKSGLLFERKVVQAQPSGDLAKTPKKEQTQSKLPTLFSLRHPLDEMAPVICRTGGSSGAAKVSFVTETTQEIVHACEEPALIITYDRELSTHSIWTYRQTKAEELEIAWGGTADIYAATGAVGSAVRDPAASVSALGPGAASRSTSHVSHMTMFSNSPSGVDSSLHCHTSHLNSPGISGLSRLNSPQLSRLAMHSRSLSPSLGASSLYRLHTSPSPQVRASPSGFLFHSASGNVSSHCEHVTFNDFVGPLAPEICLDHIWTESGNVTRDGALGAASKAFQTVDFSGQQYLCYVVNFRHHLRCIKYELSNDQSQVIFGLLSTILARDAVQLPSLPMMAVLDMNHNVVLYSGMVKINVLHIMGLPSAGIGTSMGRSSPKFETPVFQPITSSRPPSALDVRFDDEVQLLSPVPTEFSELSQMVESSVVDEPSFQQLGCSSGVVVSLRDEVANRFSVCLADGTCYRVLLAELSSSVLVSNCLAALRQTLPRDAVMLLFSRWYCQRNVPGARAGNQLEWQHFVTCLLGAVGYDHAAALRPITAASVSKSAFWPLQMNQPSDCDTPSLQLKKPRLSDQCSDMDWKYLLKSSYHCQFDATYSHLLGLDQVANESQSTASRSAKFSFDNSAPLFTHVATVLYALHLVYEEMRLDTVLQNSLIELGSLLFFIARDLRFDLYTDHYCRDLPELLTFGERVAAVPISQDDIQRIQYPSFFTHAPPNVYHWLYCYLRRKDYNPFPCIPSVSIRTEHTIMTYALTFNKDLVVADQSLGKFIRKISAVGRRVSDIGIQRKTSNALSAAMDDTEWLVYMLNEMDTKMMKTLAVGIAIPVQEAIFRCRIDPPAEWSELLYGLIGRNDLARQCKLARVGFDSTNKQLCSLAVDNDSPLAFGQQRLVRGEDDDDGMNNMDEELLKLRFSKDLRIKEVRRLLQSSKPVRVAIVQRPEFSDHEFIEEQERYLYAKCTRTMALPVGRGMFTMKTYYPVPTELVNIPKLCLTGRAPPRNTAVDLTHIEVPPNMSYWPQFHNGVAAGLKVVNSSQLESSWIVFNKGKAETMSNEHAGFLMGHGLNGYLAGMNTLNVHDYLIKGHEMTSVGLLLGFAANKRGTMDMQTTKMLSIHVSAMLPPTSTELDVPHNVQVAAVLGIGLVYQGTAHRHIAEVLLSEIGRPPGPEGENSVDREAYSLAAGLALGLVMLGRGSEAIGLSDMAMPDQLYLYMVGGQKRPPSSSFRERYKSPSCQIKEGECVNVDVTSPAATVALGLMFFDTDNSSVAEWFAVPETQSLLDCVRPDFLLLRTLSRSLIMWSSVMPSEEWVNSNVPEIVSSYAFHRARHQLDPDCDIDFETLSQAYCNIVTGACMAIGLKFAGSANPEAFTCLYETVKRVLKLMARPVLLEQAGRMTVENCLVVIVLSLAMVMAGTGDLRVLRLCRHLLARIGGPYGGFVFYGSHMAISMAVGLLFLGGGKYTLSTQPESIAAMLCAFYPKFPIHSNDNRYHLQAFRHLYVLAAEKRIVIPRDVDSSRICYVELEITYKNKKTYAVMAPCLLPELHLLDAVCVKGVRYWPVKFAVNSNWDALQKLLKSSGFLYVKQRAGYLSYAVDPKGYHSILARSLTAEQSHGKVLKSKDIQSFSSDPSNLAFAEQFCTFTNDNKEFETTQLLSQLMYEAVSQEKLEVLPMKIALSQSIAQIRSVCQPVDLWQLKILHAFYERLSTCVESPRRENVTSQEFLTGLQSVVETHLKYCITDSAFSSAMARYFSGANLVTTDSDTARKLSAFLTWYSVPHPKALAQMGLTGVPSFATLYTVLRLSHLPVGAISALCSVLRTAAVSRS